MQRRLNSAERNLDNPWPPLGRAWFTVFALLVAYTCSYIDRQILTLLVDPIRSDLNISDTTFSLLAGIAFSIFYTVMGLPLARLSDRGSRRLIVMVGVVFWSIMTVACGFANTFIGLFIARIGVGIGEAALTPAAYSIIADSFPPHKRARALAAYSMGPYIGSGLAMIIGGQVVKALTGNPVPGLQDFAPWQAAFIVVGAPGLLVAALFLLVREPKRLGATASLELTGAPAFLLKERRTFIPLMMGFSVFGIAVVAFLSWMPSVLIRQHDWSAGDAGFAIGTLLLAFATPGVYVGGWLSDHFSGRGRADAPVLIGLVAMVIVAPFAFAAPVLRDSTLLLGAAGVSAFVFGIINGLPAAALQLLTPNHLRARVAAVYFLIGSLTSLGFGPTLVALLNDHVVDGDIGLALGLVCGATVAAGAAMLWMGLAAFQDSAKRTVSWQEISA